MSLFDFLKKPAGSGGGTGTPASGGGGGGSNGKVPIKDIPYGWANPNLEDPNAAKEAIDPRTSDPYKILEMSLRHFTQKNLVNPGAIPGIVMSSKETSLAPSSNKSGMLASLVGIGVKHYIYKVITWEYEPRPWRNLCKGYDDEEFLRTLPDIGLAPDLQPSSLIAQMLDGQPHPITPGTEVWVQYKDLKGCIDPVIVKVGGDMLIEWPGDNGSTRGNFENGTSGLPGSRRRRRNSTEKQTAIKKSKDIRQKIFEEKGYDRKSGRGWKGDAILSQGDQTKLKSQFQSKINEVASNLGVSPAALEKIFRKESGTFDPYAINRDTGATGLIQFMPSTAESLGTTTEALLKMGPEKQLDYVQKYFEQSGKVPEIKDDLDLYLIVFYPNAVGKPDDYIIGSERGQRYAQLAAQQNKGYRDPSMGNLITKAAIRKKWNR